MAKNRISSKFTVSIITGGVLNLTFTEDDAGNKLPPSFDIKRIVVKPSASTIWSFRLWGKATRLSTADENFSLVYESTWSAFTVASDAAGFDATTIAYSDQDADGNDVVGQLYAQVAIKTAEAAATFAIQITIEDPDG